MIWEIISLILIGPLAGYIVAYLARDELIQIRKYTKWVFIIGILVGAWMFLIGEYVEGYASFFASIVGIIAYVKSWDRKWTRKKKA